MKRIAIFIFLLGVLCACGPQKIQVSEAEYKQLKDNSETADLNVENRENSNMIAENPDDEEVGSFNFDEIEKIDISSGKWNVIKFEEPNVQIAVPAYVGNWQYSKIDLQVKMNHAAIFCTTDSISDGRLDGTMIRIKANYSDQPEPKHAKYRFDSLGGENLEWNYTDHLLLKHHRYDGRDCFSCNYYPEGYEFEIYIDAPTAEIEKYRSDFLSMVAQFRSMPIDYDEYTKEEILARCKQYSGSEYAVIEHQGDDSSIVITCYNEIQNPDEEMPQLDNIKIIRVYTYDYSAYDDMTMEPIKGLLD